jgi:UDP-N-acetylmuramoyl-tripeptide--D-alanyl-D-alanine ligase
MIAARLSQIADRLAPRLIKGDAAFRGVSTDSRSLAPGELFFALRGERFDGHVFAEDARARGAAALVVEQELDVDLPQLVVLDTLHALGDLARWSREHAQACVLGITGSNGKTSVKTLTASILSRCGICHVNAGNFNNEIGLPLSILRMPEEAQFAVLEMGAGKPGDIEYLAQIAKPRISVVNNVAPAHLERMRSVQGVAETKGAIYTVLPVDGVAVINADDAFADYFAQLAGARRQLRFGLTAATDVCAEQIKLETAGSRFVLRTPIGHADVMLPLAGEHNVRNALAASALALAAEATLDAVVAGLVQASGVNGRLTRVRLAREIELIDDSYNANPGSTRAAIDTLVLAAHPRWLVLGNMAELGPDAERLHAEIGDYARQRGVDFVLTVGSFSAATSAAFGAPARHVRTHQEAIEILRAELQVGATILVKGSRSSAMERVVRALVEAERPADAHTGGDAHAA